MKSAAYFISAGIVIAGALQEHFGNTASSHMDYGLALIVALCGVGEFIAGEAK
jgi:hypothetical protein